MTPQEQQLIDGLIQRVNGTNLPDKDPEAEQRLQQGLASNPDALYILSQTVIVQQYALDQAKQQLDALRSQQQQVQQQPPQKHTGFLESIFGSHSDQPETRPAPPPPPQQSQGYTPVQIYSPAGSQTYNAASGGYAQAPSGGGGFLRSAAQTAAGVAAGALAFQGVESLLHGFGNNMVGGGSGFGGFGAGAPREEIINNYYGDDRGDRDRGDQGDRDTRGFDDNSSNDPGNNIFTNADDTDDRSNDSATDNGQDDSSFADDGGIDDSGSDDSGSFDGSGSDDSGDLGNDNSF